MQQYDYIPVNGNLIANVNGRRLFIDPGLPASLASRPLLLDGLRFDVKSEALGLSIEDFNHLAGVELDGVLGGDVADRFVLSFLPGEHALVLDQYMKDFPITIEIQNLGGLPMLQLSINHKLVKGVLNLGTHLSLIHQDLVKGFEPIGREKELFGFIGEREVDVYSLPVMIDRQVIYLRFGVLPAELADWLDLANVKAALGSELLQHFAVSIAMQHSTLAMQPLH